MTLKLRLLLFFISVTLFGFSQNMQKGFTHLESGEYSKAELFFEAILKDYPENKTAHLCYGRAVGLNGDAEKANVIFTNLLDEYPSDFEIKLNYAESLLWNKNFTEAKTFYKTLITEEPNSFPALLGFANTLSNLKQYEEALVFVNRALDASPGNPNALISKKYIYLGFAYQKQQMQQYTEAETLLNKNLELYGEEKETLQNLANLYLITNDLDLAKATYERLAKDPLNKIEALNGLALVSHLNGKEKNALQLSQGAYDLLEVTTTKNVIKQTTERYTQALIWNKKYKQAEQLITDLINKHPNENWVLALRATLHVYKSNFKQSLSDYNRILENDSASFDGNLGKANTLKALTRYNEAYISAENTLKFYNKQKDATAFIAQLNSSFTPSLTTKTSYTFDNGDNNAFSYMNNITVPLSTKLKVLGDYNYRRTSNSVTNNKATSNDFSLGLSYQLRPNIVFETSTGLTSVKTESDTYTQLLLNLLFKLKPFKLQTLDVGYKREVQSFNADLLDQEIIQNNIYMNYNISTNFNLGWYTQYIYTFQNDNNTRNLLFTSLYYNVLRKPSLKMGLNYQYITFKNQIPSIYFSPETFNAGEVFLNLIKDEITTKPKAWFYELTAATGLQYIEDDDSQSTYRIQAKLGYKFSERCALNAFGTRSNIASATASGFTFTEIGLRFKWLLLNAPVFKKHVEKE